MPQPQNRQKTIGYAVGLTGSAGIAWGLYSLLLVDTCDPSPCPPGPGWAVLALVAGMLLAVGAVFVAGPLLIPAPFLGVAVGAGWAGLGSPEVRTVGLVLAAVFAVPVVAPLVLFVVVRRRLRRVERLVGRGKTAIGTVIDLRDTGVTLNRNPHVELTLRIEPEDGSPAFEGKETITVSRVDLPYRGQTFPVWFDPDDRARFTVGVAQKADAPLAVQRLYAKATAADPGRPPAAGSGSDPLDRLAKLHELRQAGALTPTEFEREKAKLLNPTEVTAE